ncbi:MAG: sigma-70 family RNA polymerase sigma factor [Armatimonadetes bacterium]|nr:sigma-70 family RNA polymerase sigma factor [Armatimonadota bacterium]
MERAVPGSDDDKLARAVARGDTDAWDRFFDRYSAWAYRFAYHHLDRSHADAEDLCADILMTAARSLHRFDARRGTLDLWVLGLARHRLARFCRRRRRDLPLIPEILDAEESESGPSTDDLLEAMVTRDAVNRALASLPERQARALVGKYVEGYTVEELARLLGATPKAVESLLSRARAAFRTTLRGILGGESP